MSARAVELYSSADSGFAAEAQERAILERRAAWPYVHIYAPPNSTDVLEVGAVATQALAAAAVVVVSHRVGSGKKFFLEAVVLGANVTIVPGQATFTVDRNSPTALTNTQFMPEQGLINVPFGLGQIVNGQMVKKWRLERAREFNALDVVRIKATNVGLSVGDPTYWMCGLFGYEVPTLDVKANR